MQQPFNSSPKIEIIERTAKAHLTSIHEKTKTGSQINIALLINRG